MAIFGEKSGMPTPLPAADRTSQKKKNSSTTSWKTDQLDTIPPTKTSDTAEPVRKSKIRMLGEVTRKVLLSSSLLQGKYRYTKKAKEEIMVNINETGEGDQNLHVLRSCRDAARKMEDVLFFCGWGRKNSLHSTLLQGQTGSTRVGSSTGHAGCR